MYKFSAHVLEVLKHVSVHIDLFLCSFEYIFWADYIIILEWGTYSQTLIYNM